MSDFSVELPEFPKVQYSIKDFGAIGDGNHSNTLEINTAIRKLAEIGGGTLNVPRGIWLTGPIELKSNVNLHLEDGSFLLFTKSKEEYHLIFTNYEGLPSIRTLSPIYANHADNIAITGSGVIDGNGQLWRPVKEFKTTQRQWKELLTKSPYVLDSNEGGIWVPTESIYEGQSKGAVEFDDPNALEKAAPYYDLYRPVLLSLQYCNKVLIDGVTIQNSPAWNIHPLFCENFTLQYTTIRNPYHAQNGDGVDVDSCRNVHIHHCEFETGDDAICIKSGKNAVARKLIGPTENVHIHDCYVGWGHGGFVIGSEMSRGVRNILVEDCTFVGTDVGIRVKSAIGRGGIVENINIRNINMVDVKNEAIILTMDYVHNIMNYHETIEESTAPEDIPMFSDITLDGIICHGAAIALKVSGLKIDQTTIKNITIKNSSFVAEKDIEIENADNVIIDNVFINSKKWQ